MKIAAAIVTERGGRTCHAAIVARELGVPAVVGAAGAKAALRTGVVVTVSCAEGEVGRVYDGKLPFETTRIETSNLKRPRTAIMLNLGNPELAFRSAMLPNDGVGLARMEFIISEHIGVHPMALVNPEKVTPTSAQKTIAAAGSQLRPAGRLFHREAIGRRRHHCSSVLSQAGDRPPVGLQDQRICEAARGRPHSNQRKRTRCSVSGAQLATRTLLMPLVSPSNAPRYSAFGRTWD